MVNLKLCWLAYGPPGKVLQADAKATLHGLQGRPDLNGRSVTVLDWHSESNCFAVEVNDTDERLKVKAINLSVGQKDIQTEWESSENQFGLLPVDLALACAFFSQAHAVAALATASRELRAGIWLHSKGHSLWHQLTNRLGPEAVKVAHLARPSVAGPALFCGARVLRQLFREALEVLQGPIQNHVKDMEVVACPCRKDLFNIGIGAQGAIRSLAGATFEDAIDLLSIPRPDLSVTLVPGYDFAPLVAMTVTEPPDNVRPGAVEPVLDYLDTLHYNLLEAVRGNGMRSLAMPTLATGGMRLPVHLVAIAAVMAIHADFCAHPADPLHVRVACFDPDHIPVFNMVKEEIFDNFFAPEDVKEKLQAFVLGKLNVSRYQ